MKLKYSYKIIIHISVILEGEAHSHQLIFLPTMQYSAYQVSKASLISHQKQRMVWTKLRTSNNITNEAARSLPTTAKVKLKKQCLFFQSRSTGKPLETSHSTHPHSWETPVKTLGDHTLDACESSYDSWLLWINNILNYKHSD